MTYRLHVEGDTDAAKMLLPMARKELGILKKHMEFANLGQHQRTVRLSSGAIIHVERVLTQDFVSIEVPEGKVKEEEIKEEIIIIPEYRIKLTRIHTDEILTPNCLTRMTFYNNKATSLEDEDYIVFDYCVPDDVDEDGKLLISPEEYFGSGDNPGLEWDDSEECFVISLRWFSGLANILEYGVALGSDELKHFVTYSCMECARTDKYQKARQDQQYQEIVTDEERWNTDNLIEPSFSSTGIFEDSIACHIGNYIIAKITADGTVLVTVWDAVLNGYAKGIIDNSDDEVLDSDWPIDQLDISDWWSSTSPKAGFNFDWGAQATENTLDDCPTEPPVSCEKSDYYLPTCMQQYYYTYDLDEFPYPTHQYYDYYVYECTANFGSGTTMGDYSGEWGLFGIYSAFGDLNGFDVLFRWEMVNEVYDYNLATAPGEGWKTTIISKHMTLVTPWGLVFENILYAYTNWGYTMTGSIPTCNGEQVYWVGSHDDAADADERVGRALYKADNIIFGLCGGYVHLEEYPVDSNCHPRTYPTSPIGDEYTLDACGALEFYSDSRIDTVDPNVLNGSDDVREGFINLLQAYFDIVNSGIPQLYSVSFEHREGVL